MLIDSQNSSNQSGDDLCLLEVLSAAVRTDICLESTGLMVDGDGVCHNLLV